LFVCSIPVDIIWGTYFGRIATNVSTALDMTRMRFLIAPDKFKGSLSALQVAENITLGLRDAMPDAEIETAPVADGGEGTAEVICSSHRGKWVRCSAHGPLGDPIEARYAWFEERASAVIEMSEAAGLRALKSGVRDVLGANTFGVGEMLLDAARRRAREIIVGLGGSVTNDAGFGMARALGFCFLAGEKELTDVPSLLQLTRIISPPGIAGGLVAGAEPKETRSARTPLPHTKVVGAVDVKNPLLGKHGATRTFGPQKGAIPEQIDILERALRRLADVIERDLGCDFRETPGAGAAGGLGFGLKSFCHAELKPGFDVVAAVVGLEEKIRSADVVITGEGSLDRQTLEGKTPAGVARLAHKFRKRVFAVVGRADQNLEVRGMFDGVYELAGSIAEARELLRARARELAQALKH
jgi:glycerate 2-kinase